MVITNAGIVGGLIVGLVFLTGGVILWSRGRSGGSMAVTAGALVTVLAELYGLVVLKPYIGRSYDEQWYDQITTVETAAIAGLLVCAAGLVAHALSLPKR